MKAGDLVAATSRWSSGVWLYRVTRMTKTRAYVEVVEGSSRFSNPASGSSDKMYLETANSIPIRDMDHFAVVKKAHADLQQSLDDIQSTAISKRMAAHERYKASIA